MPPTATLLPSDGTASDRFAASVSISGNTVAVGASVTGAAYVFTEPSSGWANMTQTAKLTASDGDDIGGAVAISGNTVVVTGDAATVDGNVVQGRSTSPRNLAPVGRT